jgi:hypothetical protein
MDTPSQRLAAQIVARLVREGLLSAETARDLTLKVADGTLSAEDWQACLAPVPPKEDRR